VGHSPLGLCWSCALNVHLVDGTYELFRHYYALPSARDKDGREVAAVRGVLASMLGMISGGGHAYRRCDRSCHLEAVPKHPLPLGTSRVHIARDFSTVIQGDNTDSSHGEFLSDLVNALVCTTEDPIDMSLSALGKKM